MLMTKKTFKTPLNFFNTILNVYFLFRQGPEWNIKQRSCVNMPVWHTVKFVNVGHEEA